MLFGPLLHPEILAALGSAGHGSQILIADGNYPFGTTLGPSAQLVFLNLAPDMVPARAVLEALVASVPIERAQTMDWARQGEFALSAEPPIWSEYREVLREGPSLEPVERFAFYEAARSQDVALVIATGESAVYANLLLTIGVRSEAFGA